jgi:hypothetical protein
MKVPPLLIALGILVLTGIARMPVERAITQEQARTGFARVNMNLNLRTQMSQSGFVAALGGFRSLAANMVWLEANTAWEKTQWEKMRLLFETTTTLQPRAALFWDMAAWHMAWNASVAARRDETIPLEALRIRAQRRYFEIGEDFLRRGIANNPDNAVLYEKLGMLLRDKMEDHCGAAHAYRQAAAKSDAMAYVKRFAAYELSKCPGQEKPAYEELMRLYNLGEDERLPTMIVQIKELEEKLGIPPAQRIPDEHPDVVRERQMEAMKRQAEQEKQQGNALPALPGR